MKPRILYVASALLLLLSLASVIVPTNPVMAAEDEVWVDDDYNAATPGWGTTHFDNLEDGINNTNPNGIVHVEPGTYEADNIYINKPLAITGAGAGTTIVDGQYDERLFTVDTYTYVISDMTLRHGNASGWGGGIWNHMGTLIMINCIINGNIAGSDGGGICNEGGGVTLTSCTVSENSANDSGGGIYNDFNGQLAMTVCTVSGNEADDGGGIYNKWGAMILTNCTISDNTARDGNGGGISTVIQDDTLLMTNCTISGNNASNNGGGIYIVGDEVILTNCTIAYNHAGDDGGGIYNASGNLTIKCIIVYGNTAGSGGPNIFGSYTDIGGESIVGSPDPLLGPLQNNGGLTETHALMYGSPAIDACINNCIIFIDQRGLPRPVNGDHDTAAYCDVGAYEKQPAVVGGIVEPVDRLQIMSLLLGLAAFIILAISLIVIIQRKRAT